MKGNITMESKEIKTNAQAPNEKPADKKDNTSLDDETLDQASGGGLNVKKLIKTSFDILTK